jgi:tetratricopeptide (TPR) repeat protein
MEPLGTITMFFGFVDPKTKSVLRKLMKSAYNYSDFANLLVERVCLTEASHDLAFIAVLHSSKLWNMEGLSKLSEKYSSDPLIRPFLLYTESGPGEEVDWQGVLDATKEILGTHPPAWVALQMLYLNYSVAIGSHREPLRAYTLAAIANLMRSNSNLSCFSSGYWFLRAALWTRIEDQDKRRGFIEQAMELAREHNDRFSEGYGYRALASLSLSSDLQQAQEYLQLADAIFEELGHKLGLAENYDTLGGVFQSRGEFDRALDCLFHSIKIKEALGVNNWLTPTNVAWIYNIVGAKTTALEWSEYALVSACMCDNLLGYPHLVRARALIGVGKTEDALEHLDVALQYALKEGDERLMKLYDVTQTLLQRAEGDVSSALLSLERQMTTDYPALEVLDTNEYLLLLTETEVLSFTLNGDNRYSEYSGPWMEELEKRTKENELAGFFGLTLLQKARLRLKQNRVAEARLLIEEAQQLGQIYNMDLLYERATRYGKIVASLGH